jgi:hypothetical protein
MNIVIPAYVLDLKNIELILDQLYVTIESYYQHGNSGNFIIFTNSSIVTDALIHYNTVFGRDVKVEMIDFEKEWKNTNLPINDVRTRKNFIISKMTIPFIYEGDYLLMDWDVLTTGYINPLYLISDKMRFFNAKFFDGSTLRQNSIWKKIVPEEPTIGRHRWVNSGFVYFPKDLQKKLIIEYWDKFDSVREQLYRGIFLFDIIGDELIYNLMLIDNIEYIEECTSHNINVVIKNLYYEFSEIPSMFSIGKIHPSILNVHFAVGFVKPFNVEIDREGNLSYKITMERYNLGWDDVQWTFNTKQHRMGSHHYNALMFSIIWQYTRYSIREKLGIDKENTSTRYMDFFERCFINYGK